MEIIHGRPDGAASLNRADVFTGTVYFDPVLAAPGASVGNVFFSPGARTFWHSHNDGQILMVARGRGLVATRAGDSHFISGADVVHAPGGEEHFHGATPDSYLLHTAVSLGDAVWGEEVNEADYETALERARSNEAPAG